MISGRMAVLRSTYEVYKRYGVSLCSFSNGKFMPGIDTDDIGLCLYSSVLAGITNADPVQTALYFIKGMGLVFWGILVGILMYINKTFIGKIVTILLSIPLLLKMLTINDVYVTYIFVMSPLLVLLASLNKKNKILYYVAMFLIGMIGVFSHIMRKYSLLPLWVAAFVIFLFEPCFSVQNKRIGLFLFLLGSAIPYAHLSYSLHKQKVFLKDHGYTKNDFDPGYGIWHTIYLGFGFTQNKYNIIRADTCAYEAAKKIDPTVSSPGKPTCEKVMKKIVFDLLRKDRHFFFSSLFARFGVAILFFLVWFGWLGLFCSYFYPKPWYQELAFFMAFGASLIPGVLALPSFEYLSGFVACTVIYSLYSLSVAINRGLVKDLKRWIYHLTPFYIKK